MRTLLILLLVVSFARPSLAQKGAPPDKPQVIRQSAAHAYERAIAPYVAKARASYPAAKKRYLAGLPPNYQFTVWIRLCEGKASCEDVFVIVDRIKDGQIYGRLNNKPIGLKKHRLGDPLRFPESSVRNWVVLRPDGSEESNELGKFLDRWRPPQS